MNIIQSKYRMAGLALIAVLILGSGFTSSEAAGQRRGRSWDSYPNWGGSFDLRQTALNAGYNEGSKEGRKDRDKRRYRDYNSFDTYQKADKDYNSNWGDRDLYSRYFRLAFQNGYDTENPPPGGNRNNDNYNNNNNNNRRGRNWDRYGTYGGSYQLRQTALNAGYNAGIKEGRNDSKKNRHRNYGDFSQYRNAEDDYSSKLGDKELYRRYYREGFENGYEDGYRGY